MERHKGRTVKAVLISTHVLSSPPLTLYFHPFITLGLKMLNPWIMWSAVSGTARYGMLYCQCGQFVLNNFRLSTVLQILIFLPLTLATLSKQAFLLLSLLLCIHAFIHGTLALLWGSEALSVLQVPIHPFLLLVCFNVFSSSVNPYLALAVNCWGMALSFFGPLFIVMEGLSSLLVVQKLGQEGKKLVYKGESYQFVFLVAAAVAYVASAWWIVVVSLVAWLKDCSFRNESSHIQMPPHRHYHPPFLELHSQHLSS